MPKSFIDEKTKKSIQEVTLSYKKKRDKALAWLGMEETAYKQKITDIRMKAFGDFDKRLEEAKKNFKKNGFNVYEAADLNESHAILKDILKESKFIAKSKSNTAREIGLEKLFDAAVPGHLESSLNETDLGDYLVQLFQEEEMHYVLPALHLTPTAIADKIKQRFGDTIQPDAEKLVPYISAKIRQLIMQADTGVTGANFFTQSGQVVLLENEGNISLVTRVPRRHIIIAGIDKLVVSVEDATQLCQAAAVFGTGQTLTQYISIISGPSKTADIQNQLVMGAQGAKEVHILLIDNGRREMMKGLFRSMMKCINCGACINFCPVYHNYGTRYGGEYLGSKGIIYRACAGSGEETDKLDRAMQAGSHECTLCGNCHSNCPMQIDLPAMVRAIRQRQNLEGFQTAQNKEMEEKIKKFGNPFGDLDDKKVPDKLYCC